LRILTELRRSCHRHETYRAAYWSPYEVRPHVSLLGSELSPERLLCVNSLAIESYALFAQQQIEA
jgi:hypothetical protein